MTATPNPIDLFNNIREARNQINRLKNEAEVLEADPFSKYCQDVDAANHNMKEYMKNVSYFLSKNEQNV